MFIYLRPMQVKKKDRWIVYPLLFGMVLVPLIWVIFWCGPWAWGAEKNDTKGQTSKIVVDMPGQTQKQEIIVQTTQKAKSITLIGSAQAKRLKR